MFSQKPYQTFITRLSQARTMSHAPTTCSCKESHKSKSLAYWQRMAKEKKIGNEVWISQLIVLEFHFVQGPVFAFFSFQSAIRIGILLPSRIPPDACALTPVQSPLTPSPKIFLSPTNQLDCHLQWSGYTSSHCLLLAVEVSGCLSETQRLYQSRWLCRGKLLF